jgi:hypothetical protein
MPWQPSGWIPPRAERMLYFGGYIKLIFFRAMYERISHTAKGYSSTHLLINWFFSSLGFLSKEPLLGRPHFEHWVHIFIDEDTTEEESGTVPTSRIW